MNGQKKQDDKNRVRRPDSTPYTGRDRSPDLSIEDIKTRIKGNTEKEFFFYEVVSSTNTIAAELAQKGATEGAVVLADSQIKGRGRHGRLWVSPPGVNIYMSIILRPKIEPKDSTLITIMAAVGCATALRRVTGLNVTIKWPNDLMVSDKKIGGILTEMKIDHNRIIFAIIGIGININIDVDTFPDDLRGIATSIKNETGISYSRAVIIAETLNEIDHWYRILKGMGRRILLSEWQKLTSTLGREVRVTVGKETFAGLAESIDDEGMLILRLPTGELERISSGDLTILR
ncbi:MAG: biotin--[acetyl-CoA-carboxylase] ligase [Nitrospirota bacterium]